MKKTPLLLAIICVATLSFAQSGPPSFTPADQRIAAFHKRQALLENSLASQVPFKSIGPSVSSGRVADIEVQPDDPTRFYAAYASGGLWKTENNGQSFVPLFDDEMVMTIGDIAVDWPRNTLWVGTGEVNASRSSYSGVGVYCSKDGGKTWQHKGLGETHHIGKVLLSPTDSNTVWVAALGHLYAPNPERGVFKTTDGGNTWRQVLQVNENTGAVDLVADPLNPNILYAATWHRERRAWDFIESGQGSGIYKSMDGGETWSEITGKGSGFPVGAGAGRIGLVAVAKGGKTILYSIIDNQNRRPKGSEPTEGLTKDQLRELSAESFLKLDKALVADYLKKYDFPEKYDTDKVMALVRSGKIKPIALVEYVEDANSLLFDTPVVGAEVYRSTDGGASWAKTHEGFLDDLYYSYGYYFGKIYTSPKHPDKLYVFGVPVLTSEDGGKTWASIDQDNVHADHHALWIDPVRDGHLVLGNDGGINISYDDGANWVKCNTPAVGQFYAVAIDQAKNYNVYGGMQDNGVWVGPHTYEAGTAWHATGHYPYKSLLGGDGMQVAVDTRDNETVFSGFQFGNYYRIKRSNRESERVTPQHELGERPFRWNWQSPIHLSIHNQDILYLGSNFLHRSFNQGADFKVISADLTQGGRKGDVAYGTLTAIHESPLRFGLLYTGSDDGLVHLTKDGGLTWKLISSALPPDLWVSRVQASQHEEGRVFLSLNGYRWDDFSPYLYRSDDFGEHWTAIGTDLPLEPINVVKEDPKNPNLIYVGTDHGLYVSLDGGTHFMAMKGGLPAVAVHDLVVQPKENHLIVGTHGRSIYLADVTELQQLTDSILQKEIFAFELDKVRYRGNWGSNSRAWDKEVPEPDVVLPVFANASGSVKVTVFLGDLRLATWDAPVGKGLNYLEYHATVDANAVDAYEKRLNDKHKKEDKKLEVKQAKNGRYYLQKGNFKLVFERNGVKSEQKLTIE